LGYIPTIQDVKKVSEQKVGEDTVESQHRLQNANCLYTPYMRKFNIRRRGELNLLNMMLCKKINNPSLEDVGNGVWPEMDSLVFI
jgi:hypothetical protein